MDLKLPWPVARDEEVDCAELSLLRLLSFVIEVYRMANFENKFQLGFLFPTRVLFPHSYSPCDQEEQEN